MLSIMFVLVFLISNALASEGDCQVEYHQCLYSCMEQERAAACRPKTTTEPVQIIMTFWSCSDDCRYLCMWEVEQKRLRASPSSYKPFKYHGKWPFTRVLGIQEICSVMFSLLNLLAHLMGLAGLVGHQRDNNMLTVSGTKAKSDLMLLWICYSVVHILAWTSSCIFHSRDTWLTERLDYCCADAVVAIGLICATSRLLTEDDLQIPQRLAVHFRFLVSLLILMALGYHIHYMLMVNFDYGLNMVRCIAFGALTSLVWVVWLILIRKQGHPSAGNLACFLVLAYAALLFEVLDFPPLAQLLDAHSMWHLSTIPLTFLFYRFIHVDLIYLQESDGGKMKSE
jgi:hypothetical protein